MSRANPARRTFIRDWPWWWPVRLARSGFLELISQPLTWFLAAPKVERPNDFSSGWTGAADCESRDRLRLCRSSCMRCRGGCGGAWRRPWRATCCGISGTCGTSAAAAGLDYLGPGAYVLITGLFNAFPLPRSAGFRRSFQHAGEALDRGYNVLVFPEGHRTHAGLEAFRPGIGLLVKESGVPVVPVALAGLSELKSKGRGWFRSGRLTVRVGEPMRFEPDDTPEEITKLLHERLRQMLERPVSI